MNIVRSLRTLLWLSLTWGLVVAVPLRADDEKAAPAAPPEAPAAPAASEVPPAPVENAPAAVPETVHAAESGTKEETPATTVETTAEAAQESGEEAEPEKSGKKKSRVHVSHSSNRERVNIGGNSYLEAGENADVVVSIFGSSRSAGDVDDAVVSIFGGSRVTGGTVGDVVVSVLGDTYVNGRVRGGVITVLGDIEFGPEAVVDGEVVCVGGEIKQDASAQIRAEVRHVGIRGLTTWFKECLLKARLLAWDSRVWWAWCIALAYLAFYFLVSLIVPAGVAKCAETLEQKPGPCLVTAVVALILTPVAYLLLVFTMALGIGVALIPLFSFGLFVVSLFGKIVMLAWAGRRISRFLGDGTPAHPAVGVLIGGVIMMLIYTIPIVGFVSYKLLGLLGLGVVIYSLIQQFQSARPARPAPASGTVPPVPPVAPSPVPAPAASIVAASLTTADTPPPLVPPPVVASAAPPVISAATLPRVGFWLRLAASFLDFILVAIAVGMLSSILHWFDRGGSVPFWFTVYCVVMWATKGTTIGGIICGLKVVRLDDRPLDWGVAIVRALGGFLSLAVAGLGFIWVSFDNERQSWHDKIAGTTIVKVPKGTALL
jgi:uncharacterized RDD family membrane protein YckC